MENRYSNIFLILRVWFFLNPWILLYCQVCPWTPRHRFAVSADVSRVCDIVYKEERSWAGVNRTVLKMNVPKPYQFGTTYPLLSIERTSAKRRSASILTSSSKNIRWYPNSVPRCLLTIFFLIMKRNMWKICLKISIQQQQQLLFQAHKFSCRFKRKKGNYKEVLMSSEITKKLI